MSSGIGENNNRQGSEMDCGSSTKSLAFESDVDDDPESPTNLGRTNGGGTCSSTWCSTWTALMIVVLGISAASAFVWIGVSSERAALEDQFERSAADSVGKLAAAFEDYVTAASMVHYRCRHRNFTRRDFRELYEYLVDSGLHFKAVQFDPNVSRAERSAYEAEARAYYDQYYPHVDYQGIRGFNTLDSKTLEPRTQQPFYFPIHYMEPIIGNEAAIDLDYYSSESRIRAVRAVFDTQGPSLTDRLSLVKKAGSVSRCGNHNGPSYGVVLMHPGINLTTTAGPDELWPRDFSSIVLCVPDLLERSTLSQSSSSLVYIHDRSQPKHEAVFLGGAIVTVNDTISEATDQQGIETTMRQYAGAPSISFLDEVSLPHLVSQNQNEKLIRQHNISAANRIWTITVLSTEDTYVPDYLFVALGGGIILVASVCLAVWVYTNALRTARYNRVLAKAAQNSTAIVTSLFPKKVAKQMIEQVDQDSAHHHNQVKKELKDFGPHPDDDDDVVGESHPNNNKTSKPMADHFPSATILFCDIRGFTAWSSTRQPPDVFHLLESIYGSFDKIARRRRVFKVETIGDCYVAVAGLPEPRADHAVAMAKFAGDCADKLAVLLKDLEVELGPDTSDLAMRFGLNSGGVTAGVLRGERARFQLFGDTMNVAARMESTGEANRIQCTRATADLLTAAGKGHWVKPRANPVTVKGKGELQTYWIVPRQDSVLSTADPSISTESETSSSAVEATASPEKAATASPSRGGPPPQSPNTDVDGSATTTPSCLPRVDSAALMRQEKLSRLAEWNTVMLCEKIKRIVVMRRAAGTVPESEDKIRTLEECSLDKRTALQDNGGDDNVVELFEFDHPKAVSSKKEKQRKDPGGSVQLSAEVVAEAGDFVQTIAQMYRDNPFHNFEHASHVTQSTDKLMSRIVAHKADKLDVKGDGGTLNNDHTYGIASDPWTQFTVVLAGLIHDVDHPAVPNATLIKEGNALAMAYNNKSIAESNSIDLAWTLLMEDRYKNLRREIYCTKKEFLHFRALLVNTVLATDIMDKELSALRKSRWQRAFSSSTTGETTLSQHDEKGVRDRKASIVLEHLIQASDVAHTMQHWHIYTRWNRRLFHEMFRAYEQGRAETNPAEGWYDGELAFFDFYVIPLAQKLQSCGVFGVSGSEYLNFATQNRDEWSRKGKDIVESMVEDVRSVKPLSDASCHHQKRSFRGTADDMTVGSAHTVEA